MLRGKHLQCIKSEVCLRRAEAQNERGVDNTLHHTDELETWTLTVCTLHKTELSIGFTEKRNAFQQFHWNKLYEMKLSCICLMDLNGRVICMDRLSIWSKLTINLLDWQELGVDIHLWIESRAQRHMSHPLLRREDNLQKISLPMNHY